MTKTVELVDYRTCEQALKEADLKQALYDEGAILMERVLVTLHGEEHRSRRLLEMRVFRRDFFRYYENEFMPEVFERVLEQHKGAEFVDVVDFGYRVMVYLTIAFAGIDTQQGTQEEFDDWVRMLRTFGMAATLGQSRGDREAAKQEIRQTLDEFDERYFEPSAERRLALIERLKAGEIGEDDLPRDVLTVLLRNEPGVPLDRDMMVREVGFFFLAGAHTSVHSLSHAVHHLLSWCAEHPADRETLENDPRLLQQFVLESFRLHPSSPASWRVALAPVDFADGQHADTGDKVVVKLREANRQADLFGEDAAEFNPHRTVPTGIDRTGLTFGIGMHACLGKALAAGTLTENNRQLGMVAFIAGGLLRAGVQADESRQPQLDQSIERETWQFYPVRLETRS